MKKNESGIALVTVVCFAAVLTILATGLMMESSTHAKIAARQTNLEQALYAAETGIEHIATHISYGGGTVPSRISGTIGNASYSAFITPEDGVIENNTNGAHTVTGTSRINPGDVGAAHSFLMYMADGTQITRTDLHQDQSDISGSAMYVRFMPIGAPAGNVLTIDGTPTQLNNGRTYTFSGTMNVLVWNDNRNPMGKAIGQWWITFSGSDLLGDDSSSTGTANIERYRVFSTGTANGVSRAIIVEGLQQQSWARYALWYNTDTFGCWFIENEKFYGPVHANCEVNFRGDPEFFAPLTSSHNTYGGNTNNVLFHLGFELNAPQGSMADVSFNTLLNHSSLVLTGETSITFAQTNMLVTNSRRSWVNHAVPVSGDKTVYIKTALSGGASNGICQVGGELTGRATVVTEHDIIITNHITYTTHPTNSSLDALGLIANRNVDVASHAPNNLNVFAHIMATGKLTPHNNTIDGKFWVPNYNSGSPKGVLSIYGGIVQDTRGPVGRFNSSTGNMLNGYNKNYVFDTRFSQNPPPNYPAITNLYQWSSWRDMAP